MRNLDFLGLDFIQESSCQYLTCDSDQNMTDSARAERLRDLQDTRLFSRVIVENWFFDLKNGFSTFFDPFWADFRVLKIGLQWKSPCWADFQRVKKRVFPVS